MTVIRKPIRITDSITDNPGKRSERTMDMRLAHKQIGIRVANNVPAKPLALSSFGVATERKKREHV